MTPEECPSYGNPASSSSLAALEEKQRADGTSLGHHPTGSRVGAVPFQPIDKLNPEEEEEIQQVYMEAAVPARGVAPEAAGEGLHVPIRIHLGWAAALDADSRLGSAGPPTSKYKQRYGTREKALENDDGLLRAAGRRR